jgi:hypothetical protein
MPTAALQGDLGRLGGQVRWVLAGPGGQQLLRLLAVEQTNPAAQGRSVEHVMVAAGEQQRAAGFQQVEGAQVLVLPDVVQHDQARGPGQQPVEPGQSLLKVYHRRARVAEYLGKLRLPGRQVRPGAKLQPHDPIGERGLDIAVMGKGAGNHRLASPAHAHQPHRPRPPGLHRRKQSCPSLSKQLGSGQVRAR